MASLLYAEAPRLRGALKSPPEPFLSSRSRQWNGVAVELYRVRDVDTVRHDAEHVVAIVLRGPVDLYQRRSGRAYRKTMQAGDIVIAPVGEPRAVRHEQEAEVAKVLLAPSLIANVLECMFPTRSGQIELLDNFGIRDSQIEDIVRRLVGELRADGPGSRLCAESLATELAVHLVRHHSTATRINEDSPRMLPRYKLQRVTDYIQNNLREELTLENISQTLSMSPYHFAHAFRQALGLPPHRYVINCRIDRAKSLLRNTDLSVTEIAHQVGYANQSHFSVAFHKVTGQTPRGYRREA